MKINIRAIAKYLPEDCVSSAALDQQIGGVIGRIEKNTGVKTRHQAASNESVSDMGAKAIELALKKANLLTKDIDLLIFSGGAYDYPIPHNSVIIKSKLTDDSVTFPCFDVDSTCLSFLNALDIAHQFIKSGRYNRIVIVSSEIASKALSTEDEKTYGLFGDAAVAMIIEASETKGYEIRYTDFTNYPSGALYAHVPLGGAVNRGLNATANDRGYYFKMDGKNLIRLTKKHLGEFVSKMEQTLNSSIQELKFIVPHQASKYGNHLFTEMFNIPENKLIETLSCYGNCISASIPLGIEKMINGTTDLSSNKVLLIGSGAGLSLGAMVLEF